jgi:hypothetical protein
MPDTPVEPNPPLPLGTPIADEVRAKPEDHLVSWQATLSTIASSVGSLSAMVAAAAVIFVTYSIATGRLEHVARLLQGYNVTQNALIDPPVDLSYQTFADFKAGWQSKTFENEQVEEDLGDEINRTTWGRVLLWTFHVKGYASAGYQVYYEDSGFNGPLRGILCEFRAQTTDDSGIVCAYFAPAQNRNPRDLKRRVTVWLDGQEAPIAVRTYSFSNVTRARS